MRMVECKYLQTGMRVARTIYDDAGRILLNRGVVLNPYFIKRLEELGLTFIYVEDEILGSLEVEEMINERVKIQTASALRKVVHSVQVHEKLDLRPISTLINQILDELKGAPNLLMQLLDLRCADTFLYDHSIGVSVLSILTGRNLGLDELKLKTLAMGAVLHDLGKSLNPGPEHTEYGFEILRREKVLSILVAHVAYQHHERYDGTGYPRQLKEKEIHLYAAIVNVANCFDNLVNRGKDRLYPYQALREIKAASEKAFHPDIVEAFCRNIAPYPVGTAIRLNNGMIGVVIDIPLERTTQPVVKLIADKKGNILKQFPEIDLLAEKKLAVEEVISEAERQKITRNYCSMVVSSLGDLNE